MLSLLILFLLLIAFFSGARRGFALQVIFAIGYVLSFIAAQHFYKPLASHLELYIPYPAVTPTSKLAFFDQVFAFHLDEAFYAGTGFSDFCYWLAAYPICGGFCPWFDVCANLETGRLDCRRYPVTNHGLRYYIFDFAVTCLCSIRCGPKSIRRA